MAKALHAAPTNHAELTATGVVGSVGSALHGTGLCKPCAWFWKPGGCKNGDECNHCHLCPEGELKARKKSKATAGRDCLAPTFSPFDLCQTRGCLPGAFEKRSDLSESEASSLAGATTLEPEDDSYQSFDHHEDDDHEECPRLLLLVDNLRTKAPAAAAMTHTAQMQLQWLQAQQLQIQQQQIHLEMMRLQIAPLLESLRNADV